MTPPPLRIDNFLAALVARELREFWRRVRLSSRRIENPRRWICLIGRENNSTKETVRLNLTALLRLRCAFDTSAFVRENLHRTLRSVSWGILA
jgi:hypothetical protein